jgi:hypothetical protein
MAVRAGYREPARLVPGDVLALSSLHATSLMVGPPTANPKDRAVYVENSALARTVLEARSYWLPAAAIEAVLMTEHLPDDLVAEIRLPVRSCLVWFAQPVLIPGAGSVPDVTAQLESIRTLEATAPVAERGIERAPLEGFEALVCIARRPLECTVEGVLLVADDDGRLGDGVAWLVRVPDDDPSVNGGRAVLFARRAWSQWRSILDVLAAIVCWGDWTLPEQLPAFDALDATRSGRRELQKGRTRRLEEAGGLAGVVILDAHRRARSGGDAGGTHASPITHVRRGHFRRVPIGPRDDGRREVRWIAPTIVNPDGAGRDIVRVYRLPGPPR